MQCNEDKEASAVVLFEASVYCLPCTHASCCLCRLWQCCFSLPCHDRACFAFGAVYGGRQRLAAHHRGEQQVRKCAECIAYIHCCCWWSGSLDSSQLEYPQPGPAVTAKLSDCPPSHLSIHSKDGREDSFIHYTNYRILAPSRI